MWPRVTPVRSHPSLHLIQPLTLTGKSWNSDRNNCSAARKWGPRVGPSPSSSSLATAVSGVPDSVPLPESRLPWGHWDRRKSPPDLLSACRPHCPRTLPLSPVRFPPTSGAVTLRPVLPVGLITKGVGVGGRLGAGVSASRASEEVWSRDGERTGLGSGQ